MSISGPIKAVSDNSLVLSVDFYNQKSYAGPNVKNNTTALSYSAGSGTGYSYVYGTENVYIPGLNSSISSPYLDIQNNYALSGQCCPALVSYGSTAVTSSTLYTYAMLYRSGNGYTSQNYMYRYEYISGVYTSEAGVFDTSKRMDLGNGWYWAWNTFTTGASTTSLTLYLFYYYYSNTYNRVHVPYATLMKGDYTKMPPSMWTSANSARTDTTCLVDLAGTNTFDVFNTAYSSDGYPTFNGSTSCIISPENSALNTQTPTVEVWIKTNNTTQNGFFFEKGQVNAQYSLFQEGANLTWRQNIGGSSYSLTAAAASYISTSNWAHIVGTYTSGDRRLYVNGALVNSDTLTGTIATNTNGSSIGVYGGYNGGRGYYYNGSIGMVKVYNRVLTASEVLQNYNAGKGRFGL